jgi:hypothetical protein
MMQSVVNLLGTKPTDDWGRATLNWRGVLTCASEMRKWFLLKKWPSYILPNSSFSIIISFNNIILYEKKCSQKCLNQKSFYIPVASSQHARGNKSHGKRNTVSFIISSKRRNSNGVAIHTLENTNCRLPLNINAVSHRFLLLHIHTYDWSLTLFSKTQLFL